MQTIHKQILTNENGEPVGVLIPYQEWLDIEKKLDASTEGKASAKNLQRYAGSIRLKKDPLKYQQQIRDEWD
jgi:hypothetical protein